MPKPRIIQNAIQIANAEGESPGKICIAVVGAWKDHPQGDYQVTTQDLQEIVDNFEREGRDLLFDYDHESLWSSSRAAGWAKKLSLEGERLFAEVEWTPSGQEALKNKEYRYLSNVLIFNYFDANNPELRGTYMHSVALTNTPFQKELPEVLANSLKQPKTNNGGTEMKELLKTLGANTEAEAISIVNSKMQKIGDLETELNDLKSNKDNLEQRVQALKNEKQELEGKVINAEIDNLIASGKMLPKYKNTALFLRKNDKDQFDQFITNTETAPLGDLDTREGDDNKNPYDNVVE